MRCWRRWVSVLFSEPKIPQPASGCVRRIDAILVSVLFSEPKIPQPPPAAPRSGVQKSVSVLFSEPKIPQPFLFGRCFQLYERFSALQRAENSST